MLDTIITSLLLLFGVVCMIFVVLIYRKGHIAAILFLLILAFLGLFSSANWVRGFFKTVVIHTIQGYGKMIEDFQRTLEQQTQQLTQLQRQLAQSQVEIRAAQEKVGTLQGELTQSQGVLRVAQDKLVAQQQELADVNRLLKTIVGASRTEAFHPNQRPVRMIILEHEQKKSSVYVLLPYVPIAQSLQLQWHLFSQPCGSYSVQGNLLIFRWGDAASKLAEHPLMVAYVPDPDASPIFSGIELKDRRVYADGKPITFAFWEDDPLIFRPQSSERPALESPKQ